MVADSDVVCPCPVPTSFRWSQPFLGTESLQYQWKRETTDRALMARVGAVMADQSIAPETDINDERSVRRAKRQALIDAGVNPYPTKSDITAHAAELAERYASLEDGADTTDEYSLAGRIRAYRRQGKARFLVIEDVSGEIQLFCRVNNLSAEDWGLLGQLDLGDIIQARGTVASRPALGLAHERHAALQVRAAAAGEVPWPHGPRAALPPALRRPHHEP